MTAENKMPLPAAASDADLLHYFEAFGTKGLTKRQVEKITWAKFRRDKEQAALLKRLVPEHKMKFIKFDDFCFDGPGNVIDERYVSELMVSIQCVGLLNAPAVVLSNNVRMLDGTIANGVPTLITGHQRVEALRRLGLRGVNFRVLEGDHIHVELTRIAEDAPRSVLPAWERMNPWDDFVWNDIEHSAFPDPATVNEATSDHAEPAAA
jgi:hypothetical protein